MSPLLWFVVLLHSHHFTCAIVNPNNHTANVVIFLQEPNVLMANTWQAGVDCIDEFSKVFFYRRAAEKYTRSYNMVLTYAHNMSSAAAHIQHDFLKRINEAVSARPKRTDLFQLRIISDHRPYQRSKMMSRELLLADYYVIIVDNVERLQRLMRNYVSKMGSWNPGARFIVLFNNPEIRDQPSDTAIDIFNELMQNFYVHRVALLYAVQETEYRFLVNDYYSDDECRVMRVKRVGECRNGTLYPSKPKVSALMKAFLREFSPQNCTFYVCTTVSAPFVEADCRLGLEMRMLGFMRSRLHFSINQSCEQHETRGVVDSSGNWTGLLGKLSAGACDFVMGGFYPDNDVIENFWTSDCYLTDSHTWYVKRAERRPIWKALVAIFDPSIWLWCLVILVISWLFWYALNVALPEPEHYQELVLTGINAMAVSLCVSVNERPICHASRVFFLIFSIYGLNLVCTYTSKMISTFQNPGYLEQIESMGMVVAAGIPFGGFEESRDWFENEEDMWIFDTYNYTEYFEPTLENLLAVKRGKRVILSNRMYILQSPLADDIFPFPYNVFSSPIQMIMKAGFPFLIEMNTIIRNMRDVGIFEKIDADFRYNNTYLNRIAKMRPKFKELVIVLTTEHLQLPFAVLIVGISCASLTFLAELVVGCTLTPIIGRFLGENPAGQMPKVKKLKHKSKFASIQLKKRRIRFRKGRTMLELRFTPLSRRKVLRQVNSSAKKALGKPSKAFTLNFIKHKSLLSPTKLKQKYYDSRGNKERQQESSRFS